MTPLKPAQHAAPYGSARDLPSYQEMDRQIQGGKLLTRFIARKQRSEFIEIERQLNHLVAVVDRFYGRLGPPELDIPRTAAHIRRRSYTRPYDHSRRG